MKRTLASQTLPQRTSSAAARTPIRTSTRQPPGNQALQRLLCARALQAKLAIGEPDDAYEREADRVADAVMAAPAAAPAMQRKCVACEEEERLARKAEDGASPTPDATAEGALGALRGRGAPLSPELRDFFEPRFGTDLGGVRLHTDAAAGRLADSLAARAFTYGHDIAFSPGEHAPATQAGRWLLAHELAHVLQQTGSDSLSRSPQPYVARVVCPGRRNTECVGPCTDAAGRASRCSWRGLRIGCICPSVSPEPPPYGFFELLLLILLLILTRGAIRVPVTPGLTPPITPGMPSEREQWAAAGRPGRGSEAPYRALAAAGSGERQLVETAAGTRAMIPAGVGDALAAEPQSYFAFLGLLDQARAGLDLRSAVAAALDRADAATLLRLMQSLRSGPAASLRSVVAGRLGGAAEGRALA